MRTPCARHAHAMRTPRTRHAYMAQELHRELRARAASLALPPQHSRSYLGGEDDTAEAERAAWLLLSPRLLDLSCAVRELRPSARRSVTHLGLPAITADMLQTLSSQVRPQ